MTSFELFIKSLIIIFGLINSLAYSQEDKFIKNFFDEKNEMISLSTCWNRNKVKDFVIDNLLSNKPKFIAAHRNITINNANEFFKNRDISHWFVMDFIKCGNFEGILNFMNDNFLFRSPRKHLFLIEARTAKFFFNVIASCNIFPMSEIVIAIFRNNSWAELTQPYKYENTKTIFLENYGIWSGDGGVFYNYQHSPSAQRRRDFKKSEIVIGVVLTYIKDIQGINFEDLSESRVFSKEPFFVEDFPNIYNMVLFLNATFSLRLFDSYGYLNHSTGKFDGLVKDIMDEGSQLSGTALIMSEDRQRAVEFLKASAQYGVKFILKKPSMSYIENIFLMTFTRNVWIASSTVLLIFGIGLYVLINWEYKTKAVIQKDTKIKYTSSDIILISLEAICQQGASTDSNTYSGRMLILFLFTAFMFLYVAYSAYIIVLLQSTKPISSIRQLLDSRIDCGGLNLSYMATYYETTNDDALKNLYKKKVIHNKYIPLEIGMKRVQDGNFAFHVTLSTAYNYILKTFRNYDICKLQELPGYMTAEMYVVSSKTSQFKKLFKVGLFRIHETGLQVRTKHRVSIKPTCYNEAGNFQSVGIFDCYSVFILYIVGGFLSILIFCIEKLVAKYKHVKFESIKEILVKPIEENRNI